MNDESWFTMNDESWFTNIIVTYCYNIIVAFGQAINDNNIVVPSIN